MKCFTTLGLPDTASPEEVKQAYRKLAAKHHPDKGGDPATFTELNRAYVEAMNYAQEPKICEACRGEGKTYKGSGFHRIQMPCEPCGGTGKIKPKGAR